MARVRPVDADDKDALLAMFAMYSLEEILKALALICRDEALEADDVANEARWKKRRQTCLDAAQLAAMDGL